MKDFDVLTAEKDEIINIVCMYYARLSSEDIAYKTNKTKDLKILAEHFNIKLKTLNNYKDYYDARFQDNGRKGWWQRPMESYPKLYSIYNRYKDLSIAEHEILVNNIMTSISNSQDLYFSIKTKDPDTVELISKKSSSIVFNGINVHQNKLKSGQIVFIVLGGDKPKWDTGLIGMGVLTKEPFDIGYENKNFKIEVAIKLLLNKTIKRADLVPYKNTYDIIGIGPITKWEPNQALSEIDAIKAVALMRAMLDFDKSIEEDLSSLVTAEIMQKIKSATPIFEETMIEYGGYASKRIAKPIPLEKQESFSISKVIQYIKETGLIYTESLIKRFSFSLMAKRFLILSGLAGSGKTQLALAFANALIEDKKQLCVVSVGADWTNREPLLGFPNALQADKYEKPESGVLDLLIEANKEENKNKPYFLVLDEMNMSYVERYFADFLSVMESGESISLWNGEGDVPKCISMPNNLFIIGTINVDETTYMFSPKVLDRANVIEFKISQDEMSGFLKEMKPVDRNSINGKAAGMGVSFVQLASEIELNKDENVVNTLQNFFSELKKVNAEFGYRTATEIFRYIAQAQKNDDTDNKLSENEIIDSAIVQKLLPKLHGSRKKLEPVLMQLWKLCFPKAQQSTAQIIHENVANANYKESADKILRMYESANANGFTSFAEA